MMFIRNDAYKKSAYTRNAALISACCSSCHERRTENEGHENSFKFSMNKQGNIETLIHRKNMKARHCS